jgi:anti-sigma regulatory factor (Ser/Thr protein kinase)
MSPTQELRVAADLRAMDKVRGFMKKVLRGVAMNEEDGFKIELSLHEICINIALYAYPGQKGEIVLRAWRDGETAWFEFRDTGVAFDPRPVRPPDIMEKLRTGGRGGFGIYLFRTLMDGYEYRRESGQNVLLVFKKLRPAGPSRSV